MAMILIQTITVASSQAAIDFTSIPTGYKDLRLVASIRNAGAGDHNLYLKINNAADTTSNTGWLYGSGTAAVAGAGANTTYLGVANHTSDTASVFSNHILYVKDYAGSNKKLVSVQSTQENNSSAGYVSNHSILWNDTSAINRLYLYLASGNTIEQYSSASLYGIR